ncbi:hypothetical protein HF324_11410 [Chitinophaga oryzae]|uniref:Uncharacterized protein n=1 Tax=Chitinophaga oryzae TaxID=2725414 RepID=A0AAE6ZHE2_9BACT|nr:hypothetical protein [Chitinophaga oryzae]QJB31962.1 hypothetical protein HF329_11735 [Chitinophaga oryzae]QJB38440.1 hypothetical protein HF324_11410 [Chitinophaga oryzae]
MAFSEPFYSLTETFYYDKRDKEFYSIHFADYMLLNDDLSLNEAATSSYPDGIAALIADRIGRAEKEDETIIVIPSLDLEKRKAVMQEFITGICDERLLNILKQRIKNHDGSQRFDFYFGEEATDDVITRWETLKRDRVITVIHQFMDYHRIDLEASHVWDIGDSFSIDLDLR